MTSRVRRTVGIMALTVGLTFGPALMAAAHCTKGTLGKSLVTFDSVIALAPPSPLPVAKDPANGPAAPAAPASATPAVQASTVTSS